MLTLRGNHDIKNKKRKSEGFSLFVLFYLYATIDPMTPEQLQKTLLEQRIGNDEQKQNEFLKPDYQKLHNPYLMRDMETAVLFITELIAQNKKICIYSDYDADGIPGSVVLSDYFDMIGFHNYTTYIPHRHDEGYGLHTHVIDQCKTDGTDLIITIDVGITAVDEINYANSIGIPVIVTDHHDFAVTLPSAYAILHPRIGEYPDPNLCGSGVVFKLVCGMHQFLSGIHTPLNHQVSESLKTFKSSYAIDKHTTGIKWLLDMVAIATLSDMVPLIGENRILAYYGMIILGKNTRTGLQELFRDSGTTLSNLTETDIVFSITPKLNAASRMAHPIDAYHTLKTRNPRDAVILAKNLSSLNDKRKKIVRDIMITVDERFTEYTHENIPAIICIGDILWPVGVLGIIASKIVDKYNKPVFVWGSGGNSEIVKGSVRGNKTISVTDMMHKCSDIFSHFGGHTEAGGFALPFSDIEKLEQLLINAHTDIMSTVDSVPENIKLTYDQILSLSDITTRHYQELRTLAPFGVGNPVPVFLFPSVQLISVRQFGKTMEHLEIVVTDGTKQVKAIQWYADKNSFRTELQVGNNINLYGEFDYSVFRGKSELRLKIVDIV